MKPVEVNNPRKKHLPVNTYFTGDFRNKQCMNKAQTISLTHQNNNNN